MSKKTTEPKLEPQSEPVFTDGLLCPSCRYKMRVYMTRPLTGAVYRQRICDRCGTRAHTEEKQI
jgi:C4-type Zn-finger protein